MGINASYCKSDDGSSIGDEPTKPSETLVKVRRSVVFKTLSTDCYKCNKTRRCLAGINRA